jgi:hypothetical protein
MELALGLEGKAPRRARRFAVPERRPFDSGLHKLSGITVQYLNRAGLCSVASRSGG